MFFVCVCVCANKTSALCVVYAWGLRGLVTLMLHVCRHQINALFRRRLVYAQCQAVCWRAIMGLCVHLTFIFPQQIEAINFLTTTAQEVGYIPDTYCSYSQVSIILSNFKMPTLQQKVSIFRLALFILCKAKEAKDFKPSSSWSWMCQQTSPATTRIRVINPY